VPLIFGTPPDTIKKLHAATQLAMNADGPKAVLAREATDVALSKSPEDFAAFLKEDAKLWTKLVKDSGAKAN
jgi:tripartite-type tricarboxylate transporter receptor subunit TctC